MIIDHAELITGPMWFILMTITAGTFGPMGLSVLATWFSDEEDEA